MWLLIVISFITLRFTSYSAQLNEHDLFNLFILYMIPTWLLFLFLGVIDRYKAHTYLEVFHHDRWKEITYSPLLKSYGVVNNVAALKFYLASDDLSDPIVKILKQDGKLLALLLFVIFITSPLMFFIIIGP